MGCGVKKRLKRQKRQKHQKITAKQQTGALVAQCGTMMKLHQQTAILRLERMAQQLILDILPSTDPTLQNMVPGGNGALIAAVDRLSPGQTLYVWGPDGSGRSHLLRAAASHHHGHYIEPGTDEQLLVDFTEALATGHGHHCVAVDDIHLLGDLGLAALFGLYNRWRQWADGPDAFSLLVAGDRAPLQMTCREDVRSRLGWGAVYRLEPLSDAEKVDALTHHAKQLGMPLSDDVVRWLLTHGSRDIRALFAVLDALDRYALANHRALTLPLLKTMLASESANRT
jgi:DnaA family protein